MEVQTEEQGRETKVHSSLVTRLSSELLFTLENVERHARNLKRQSWMLKSRKQALDQMLEDTQRMNGLLKELMNTVKPGN